MLQKLESFFDLDVDLMPASALSLLAQGALALIYTLMVGVILLWCMPNNHISALSIMIGMLVVVLLCMATRYFLFQGGLE